MERNPEIGIRFLMSSRIKCKVNGANVLWEWTAGHFTPHYPKTLLLSGDRLVGEEDARVDHLVVFVRLAAHGLFICWSLDGHRLWMSCGSIQIHRRRTTLRPTSLRTNALQKTVPAGQAVATFKPKTLC
jgi:hypothetical protein